MKRRLFSIAGLPAVLLALGLAVSASLALAGCDSKIHDDCSKAGGCYPNNKCDNIHCPANTSSGKDCNC